MKNPLIILDEEQIPDFPESFSKLLDAFDLSVTPTDVPIIVYKKSLLNIAERNYVASPLRGVIEIASPYIRPVRFNEVRLNQRLDSSRQPTPEIKELMEKYKENLQLGLPECKTTLEYGLVHFGANNNFSIKSGFDPHKTSMYFYVDFHTRPHYNLETRMRYNQEYLDEKARREKILMFSK